MSNRSVGRKKIQKTAAPIQDAAVYLKNILSAVLRYAEKCQMPFIIEILRQIRAELLPEFIRHRGDVRVDTARCTLCQNPALAVREQEKGLSEISG